MSMPSNEEPLLSWIIKRPVLDRYILRDISAILVLSMTVCLIIVGIIFMADQDDPQPWILLMMAGIMVGSTLFAGLIVIGLLKAVHRKGITQIFMLRSGGAYFLYDKDIDGGFDRLQTFVGAAGVLSGNVHWMGLMERERANRDLAWKNVSRYAEDSERMVITLYRKLIPAMRIYCPDPAIYQQARDIIHQHVLISGGTS